ncbi:MAG: hypothetical protein WDN31_22170 [Hyphomicrobium sp.]
MFGPARFVQALLRSPPVAFALWNGNLAAVQRTCRLKRHGETPSAA